MEPLAAAPARRRLVAFALSAVKPAPTGPTAMGILGRDPAVLATAKCAVASGLYAHPSSSFSAAEDAYFSNGAAFSSIKGTGGECLWSNSCAASSSDNDSCGAYFSYGAACSRVKGTDAGFFRSYGAATASSEDPSKATLGARGPGLLSSSPTMTRQPSRAQTQLMGVRYFSAKPSQNGSNKQDPEMKIAKTLVKALTGKTATAGRNSSGRITSFHRGCGHKRSLREIDFKRDTSSVGIVERIEYDPNRSSKIALVRWIEGVEQKDASYKANRAPVNYILASHQMEVGSMVVNSDSSKPSTTGSLRPAQNADSFLRFQELFRKAHEDEEGTDEARAPITAAPLPPPDLLDLNSKVGNCMPLADIRMGTWVHSIECRPGQGAQLVRAAGTYAKVVKESASQCLVRLPSGAEKLIDSRCRATIGIVSNLSHGAQELRKAGHSRWLGWRPVVRGVAMNPVDHPHGGGEGRTKGGRPSVSPWGKPTKAGYKTARKQKT